MVRRKQPGVYLKVVALSIPREHKLEHGNSLEELTDEQIEQAIEAIQGTLSPWPSRSRGKALAPGRRRPCHEWPDRTSFDGCALTEPRRLGLNEQIIGAYEQVRGRPWSDKEGVASSGGNNALNI